jgi:peptidoglycan hydrolase-like protein with peptidoglycan-binding domain
LFLFPGFKRVVVLVCALLICTTAVNARTAKSSHKRPAAKHSSSSAVRRGKTRRRATIKKATARKARPRGQQGITNDRAREIQEALIRANYLDGEPSGQWDQRTKDAMARFQQDNGWQTKVIPDSRALIKLGLGPKHADLINPEVPSSAFSSPALDPERARGDMHSGGMQP